MSGSWTVYLVECADGTWYTGIATDVGRRIDEHNRGVGARYTRGRGPVVLLAQSAPLDRSSALKLEHRIKRLPRADKLEAITGEGTAASRATDRRCRPRARGSR